MTRRGTEGFMRYAASILVAVVLSGCCSPGRQAAMELDKVARSIDRYGFASISTPFLAGTADEFEFDLDKSATEFFDMALSGTQGGVRHLDARAIDAQAALRVNLEQAIATLAEVLKAQGLSELRIAKVEAGAKKAALEGLVAANPALGANPLVASTIGLLGVAGETPEPELPEFAPKTEGLPDLGPPFTTEQRAALSTVGAEFTPGRPFPEQPFTLTAREALLIASGDVMTQSLFRWFSKPTENKQANYELFFCPMIVSVQPGYQTREKYLADITVNVDLGRIVDEKLELLSNEFRDSSPPIQVAGVFPVVDSQVLDLVNSRRRLHSMAFQLSLLGFGQQADFFLDYAKKLEQDAQTKTSLTTASAYTAGDTAFGFRVEPKFVASKDPTRLITEPGRILESKTFPAMAAVLVSKKYLAQTGCKSPDKYKYLVFETSTRWSPMTESRRVFGGVLSWGGRFSEVESWSRALALDKAHAWIDETTPKKLRGNTIGKTHHIFFGQLESRYQQQHLASRLNTLRKLALDSRAIVGYWYCSLSKEILVEAIHPRRGWWDQYTVLTIRGQGFHKNVKAVTVGGIPCQFTVADKYTLLVAVPPWGQVRKELPNRFGEMKGRVAEAPLLIAADAALAPSGLKFGAADPAPAAPAADPLPPSAQRLLKHLEGKLKKGGKEGKLSDEEKKRYDELADTDAKYQAWVVDRKRQYDLSNAWAEIAIAARVPVRLATADNQDQAQESAQKYHCKYTPKPADRAPRTEPQEARIPVGLKSPQTEADHVGWILFDKSLPAKGSKKPAKGEVKIVRDDDGRITDVKTGEGGFTNGAELLRLIKEALQNETDFSLELNAEGGVRMNSGVKAEK